jgi:aminoglycoside phosphotransferase (APT) family kinase protein
MKPAILQIDEPAGMRPGEELDGAKVDSAIKKLVHVFGSPEIREYLYGDSNLTYLVRYAEREFVLRRPPFGYIPTSAHDMRREVTIISALQPVYSCAPKVIAFFDDPEILGCDFYIMERIRGIILRRDLPEGLCLQPYEARRLCLNLIDKLIELHAIDYRHAGLERIGKGKGYVARQITGWIDRYRKSRSADISDFEQIIAWLQEAMPGKEAAACIVHNDFRFDNVVLNRDNPFEIVGVLDWEMATIGDPLMDLGNMLAYWVQPDDDEDFQKIRRQPTHIPGMLTRQEVLEYYVARTGIALNSFNFYLVYGLFRLAVIMQQIYYRYSQGQTRNTEVAKFGTSVNYLHYRCERLIRQHSASKSLEIDRRR